MIRHSETAKMSKTLCFFILGGQLAGSGGRTLFSDSLKLQLYQHRDQLILLKVEVYLKPPHLNIALWAGNVNPNMTTTRWSSPRPSMRKAKRRTKNVLFVYRLPSGGGKNKRKQGKKVCKPTAFRCYQCFSLRLLLFLASRVKWLPPPPEEQLQRSVVNCAGPQ